MTNSNNKLHLRLRKEEAVGETYRAQMLHRPILSHHLDLLRKVHYLTTTVEGGEDICLDLDLDLDMDRQEGTRGICVVQEKEK